MPRGRRGFTLVEALVIIVMIGILTRIIVPRFRVSNTTRVRNAARQMASDLEVARTRALSTVTMVRVLFNTGSQSYTGYLDDNRDQVFGQTTAETNALGVFKSRTFTDGVQYGRGTAPIVPGTVGAGPVTFASTRLDFATMGITNPFGTTGVIYLTSANDANAVAAVAVSPAAGIRVWQYKGGAWQ